MLSIILVPAIAGSPKLFVFFFSGLSVILAKADLTLFVCYEDRALSACSCIPVVLVIAGMSSHESVLTQPVCMQASVYYGMKVAILYYNCLLV